MIDTIIICIPVTGSNILNYDAFNPSAKGMFEAPFYTLNQGYMKCTQTSTATERKHGIYKPKLTISKTIRKHIFSTVLKIEFSAPKLLYGNNFDEFSDIDFYKLLQLLHNKLQEMNVYIDIEELKFADVVAIHYGKNIILDHITARVMINTIAKMDVTKRLDLGSTDFRNNGHAIRFHANHYELSFYDKVKDLKQSKISEKRALEQDSYIQYNILEKATRKGLEVLRMEVRLNNKQCIKNMLDKIGKSVNDMTLQNYLSNDIARKVLQHHWEAIIDNSLGVVLLSEQSDEVILSKLISGGFRPSKAFRILGELNYIKSNSIRQCKDIDKSFSRTRKELEIANIDLNENYLFNNFQEAKRALLLKQELQLSNHLF
tara:strand:- start:1918 stop:3039 length:1122 start_codon:yes stop_codon:yes gene_type:complete